MALASLAWALLAAYQDRALELVQQAKQQKSSSRLSFPFYSLQQGWQRLFALGRTLFYRLWPGSSAAEERIRDLFPAAGGLCR